MEMAMHDEKTKEQLDADAGKALALCAKEAALYGSGQDALTRAILRHGLVLSRMAGLPTEVLAHAALDEPLVLGQNHDVLSWLLQQEADNPSALGPQEGVSLLFQSANASQTWVRFFRVKGDAYRQKAQAAFERLAERAARTSDPMLQGLLALPVGSYLSPEAVKNLLDHTRWKYGHWMAAIYEPHRGGFVPMGLSDLVLGAQASGEATIDIQGLLGRAIASEPDLDILPARANEHGLGALWGGEAIVRGLSEALKASGRADIQWTPVDYDAIRIDAEPGSSPFLGVNLPSVEHGLLGLLMLAPTSRVLVAFEPHEDPRLVRIGVLDQAAEEWLLSLEWGVKREDDGRLSLPIAQIGWMATRSQPVWDRLIRLG